VRISERQKARLIYWVSWAGFVLTFPAWLFGWVSDRTMLGVTLALSFFALILEARNGIRIDSE
jgi:hypothetical protein